MIGLIVAVSPDNIIGVNNTIPWNYPLDLKRFSDVTRGSTVIMGRNTWESIGRPLKNRRNIVITSRPESLSGVEGIELFPSIKDALATATGDVWFIGGKRIYEEALKMGVVDVVDVTMIPDRIPFSMQAVTLNIQHMLAHSFVRDFSVKHPDPRLTCVRYYLMGSMDAQAVLGSYHSSASCRGEQCSVCGIDATHKLGEEIMHDDPFPERHNLTAYVCCEHFRMVLGPATRCSVVKMTDPVA